jgi:pimeloyl-ACP methyl ester carboxylesterase
MEIHRNGSRLFYEKTGNGPETLLVFHGFGQDHSAFSSLVDSLKSDYTCYAFDLFFHGQSIWANGDSPIKTEILNEFVASFIQKEKLDRFSIAAFSIGARFAFSIAIGFPDHIKSMYLIAPDGLRPNWWYWIATGTSASRMLFRKVVNAERLFGILIDLAAHLGVNKKALRFARAQMATKEKRRKVYLTWVTFRHLNGRVREVSRSLHQTKARIFIYTSPTDEVVTGLTPGFIGKKLPTATVRVTKGSHHRMIDDVKDQWISDFYNEK